MSIRGPIMPCAGRATWPGRRRDGRTVGVAAFMAYMEGWKHGREPNIARRRGGAYNLSVARRLLRSSGSQRIQTQSVRHEQLYGYRTSPQLLGSHRTPGSGRSCGLPRTRQSAHLLVAARSGPSHDHGENRRVSAPGHLVSVAGGRGQAGTLLRAGDRQERAYPEGRAHQDGAGHRRLGGASTTSRDRARRQPGHAIFRARWTKRRRWRRTRSWPCRCVSATIAWV